MSRYHDLALSYTQAWFTLGLTIGCEVAATLLLKLSDGFTRPVPSAGSVVGFSLTVVLLAKVLEVLPTSIAYAAWTGAGSAVIAVVGVVGFAENLTLRAAGDIALVVVGVAVLHLSGGRADNPSL